MHMEAKESYEGISFLPLEVRLLASVSAGIAISTALHLS
jgi:hypothetical protein